jgi:signal transduction histidine kinase
MSDRIGRGWRRLVLLLRGVRGRLAATYLAAAIVLAATGVALFSIFFERGLLANVDTGLVSRADSTAADIASTGVLEAPQPTAPALPHVAAELNTITAIYSPAGALVDAQPPALPGAPLTTQQRLHPAAARSIRTISYDGDSFRMLTEPLPRLDGVWQIVVADNLDPVTNATGQLRRVLFVAAPMLLALVTLGAWLVSGAALRPVDRMRADAEALSAHDDGSRITEPPTVDSLNRLARTFNTLLDRLRISLDRQRALVADAGHELRTPLAVLQTELETAIRPYRTRQDLVESITHAQDEVARLAVLANNLLFLAEADGGHPIVRRQTATVSGLFGDVERAFHRRLQEQGIDLDTTRRGPDVVHVDPFALRRILDNLLLNALRHTPPGGQIIVAATVIQIADADDPGDWRPADVELVVTDTGPGFPEEFLPHAFDRFARADKVRTRSSSVGGSGLGLAIVAALAAAHDGTVSAANGPTGGATVRVVIPSRGHDSHM